MQTSNEDRNTAEYCIVLCTCPDGESAKIIAGGLVENKLAACVNIIPGLTSVYEWQGKIENSQELLLLIKTKSSAFDAITNAILDHHPYELPEIISIPLNHGLDRYLSWIGENIAS